VRAWNYLNQPFTIWALSVASAVLFVAVWRPYELNLQHRLEAEAEHTRLHVEVKSRLQGLRDSVRERLSVPELRRSLDTGAAATVNREMETRSLRSLAMEHDELNASGRVHCPIPFLKGTETIYEALRGGGPETVAATKTGVEALLAQLGGSAN
jgi:hypothetical protein